MKRRNAAYPEPRETPPPQVLYSQTTAREHYAPARALKRQGMLALMCIDMWNPFGQPLDRLAQASGSPVFQRFAEHFHPELGTRQVQAMFRAGLEWRLRLRYARDEHARFLAHVRIGEVFSRAVNRAGRQAPHEVFYGFNCYALETIKNEKSLGHLTIVDQVDPADDQELVRQEQKFWPGWEAEPEPRLPVEYYQRLQAEWAEAGLIVVNSDWTKTQLVRQGASAGKIAVIPCGFDPPPERQPRRFYLPQARLQVLFVGVVRLRKGVQYLLEAARRLAGERVGFTIAGPLFLNPEIVRNAPASVKFTGRVTNQELSELYRTHDVLVFPTISDGFGLVQLEALAHGLPVIATPNCGAVVTDGVAGFVVPVRDAAAIAQALAKLIADRRLLEEMSRNALENVKQFSIDLLGQRLKALITARRTTQEQAFALRGDCVV